MVIRTLLRAPRCLVRVCCPHRQSMTRRFRLALIVSIVSLVVTTVYVVNRTPGHSKTSVVFPVELASSQRTLQLSNNVISEPPRLVINISSLDRTNIGNNSTDEETSVDAEKESSQTYKFVNISQSNNLRKEPRVLVLIQSSYYNNIVESLELSRIRYKVYNVAKPLSPLVHKNKAKYALIIFDRFETYLNIDEDLRNHIDEYCRRFNVGILTFALPAQRLIYAKVKGFPLYVSSVGTVKDMSVEKHSPILHVTKSDEILSNVTELDWTVFFANHSTYSAITSAHASVNAPVAKERVQTAILDSGEFDGVRRIILGNSLTFWLHRLLFVDALSYLSEGLLRLPLERYLQIDIDDIFVGKSGIRMTSSDVQGLLDSQSRLSSVIPGFHYNLGFSGKFYKSGSEEENKGDEALIENAQEFWWFCHMWSHAQAHKLNYTSVRREMLLNKQFAKEHNIPVNQSYAVAPHHSGVFPVHEELYEAWRNVWGVKVTSTEEYPHLRPSAWRRGFVHRGIQVLPRQTCGLFTHTVFRDKFPQGGAEGLRQIILGGELFLTFLHTPVLPRQTCGLYTKNLILADYPGGPDKLHRSVYGGELFRTFLTTPVMVFMTHLSNYGNDRLAIYTFEEEVAFIRRWTNLQLRSVPPAQLAEVYFRFYPHETQPLWRNPCDDKRHMEIWASHKQCTRLPQLLVVGPQKTGTSALHSFLTMHPAVVRNHNSAKTYEEVQFFSSNENYLEGLDWYLEYFPDVTANRSRQLYFEKSATYFSDARTPHRVRALLPNVKIIIILIDPIQRAYSWYQHQRAHEMPVATRYTFHDVMTASDRAPAEVVSLRDRCVQPGMYAYYLENWLKEFSTQQLLVLDGEQLRNDPAAVMTQVQTFLELSPVIDYQHQLRYVEKKGFYCKVQNDKTTCLGVGKGRQYPPMESRTTQYLHKVFHQENIALFKLLNKINQVVPSWLSEDLRNSQNG